MNITWILPGRLAASGVSRARSPEELRAAGIGAVISLTHRPPWEDGTPDGIRHLHLPVPDMTPPAMHQIDRAVRFLRKRIAAGEPVLVHCTAGYGRTGTIIACYLVAEGRDPEEAIREVRAARPGSIETEEQEECVRRYRPVGEDSR